MQKIKYWGLIISSLALASACTAQTQSSDTAAAAKEEPVAAA